jgi:hypothetical protein
VDAERSEEAQDATRLGGARRVVVPRDHHHFALRQRGAQTSELEVRVQDRRVRRPHLVEHVAGDEHDLGRELDGLVDRPREGLGDVRLALIDPTRSQPLILAVSEVQIGEVDEAQKLGGLGRLVLGALSDCARGG